MSTKFTGLPALVGTPSPTDIIAQATDPAGTPVSNKVTWNQVIALLCPVGAASPVGTLTPSFIGQNYSRTSTPPELWRAIGLTNADWIQLI